MFIQDTSLILYYMYMFQKIAYNNVHIANSYEACYYPSSLEENMTLELTLIFLFCLYDFATYECATVVNT